MALEQRRRVRRSPHDADQVVEALGARRDVRATRALRATRPQVGAGRRRVALRLVEAEVDVRRLDAGLGHRDAHLGHGAEEGATALGDVFRLVEVRRATGTGGEVAHPDVFVLFLEPAIVHHLGAGGGGGTRRAAGRQHLHQLAVPLDEGRAAAIGDPPRRRVLRQNFLAETGAEALADVAIGVLVIRLGERFLADRQILTLERRVERVRVRRLALQSRDVLRHEQAVLCVGRAGQGQRAHEHGECQFLHGHPLVVPKD